MDPHSQADAPAAADPGPGVEPAPGYGTDSEDPGAVEDDQNEGDDDD
ncbi:MAG: hypothetical protein WA944_16025 [Mycobacterium sp.]